MTVRFVRVTDDELELRMVVSVVFTYSLTKQPTTEQAVKMLNKRYFVIVATGNKCNKVGAEKAI